MHVYALLIHVSSQILVIGMFSLHKRELFAQGILGIDTLARHARGKTTTVSKIEAVRTKTCHSDDTTTWAVLG